MRIHVLEIAAFGPFAGTERIDFDALSDAGLFLLCGPTGAGKTSVLDAVCFGLYGEVPGDRNAAKRLRSDHADPATPPSVTLEVTIAGRRLRLRRTPNWTRPKRRGSGTTTAHASVILEERRGDEGWVHLSSRLDETGQLITDLLGMTVTQFTQVALLPQGRFQAFLRARSDERHRVLQRLFRTGRFEDVERWLVSHRQALRGRNQRHHDTVAALVSRTCEAADTALPDGWDLHDLHQPAESGQLRTWASDLAQSAAARRRHLEAMLERATDEAAQAREQLEVQRRHADLRERHGRAAAELEALEQAQPERDREQVRLERAVRAAQVVPVARLAHEADRLLEGCDRAWHEAAEHVRRSLDLPEDAEMSESLLVDAEAAAVDEVAAARALLPLQADRDRALADRDHARDHAARARTQRTALDEQLRSLPDQAEQARGRLELLRATATSAPELAEELARSERRLEAARRVIGLDAELVAAEDLLRRRVDRAQELREAMHEIREARISGMAAELAAALASGQSCPVCGATDHPQVARPAPGAPTRRDEESAREQFETADFHRQAQAEAVATVQRNLAVAREGAAGRDAADLERESARLRAQLQEAQSAVSAAQAAQDRVEELERRTATVREQLAEQDAALIRAEQDERHHERRRLAAEEALAAALEGHDSIDALIEQATTRRRVVATALEALRRWHEAGRRGSETWATAQATAREHGFDDVAAALAAALSPDDRQRLDDVLREHDQARTRADAVLQDPHVRRALAEAVPDVDAASVRCRGAEDRLAEVTGTARAARHSVARLGELVSALGEALTDWEPDRAAHAVARSMSAFVEGKHPDNTLQMRLSAYVLSARLRDVVAAANERLGAMTDQRYTLEHAAVRGVGESRGGLSLSIRDQWTGESRDPATLSGGETFVTSLALALGLADVVTREAGGVAIETLFIDEGFGSLDPETLDDVMDTLDSLRDGGRAVGVVSHVPEMRSRIPTQLHVSKGRGGSRVEALRVRV
jgi:exonuclease SbcC